MRSILEDDSIHYLFSLCDELGEFKKDVLYYHVQKNAGLSYKDIDLIVDCYNQRNESRYDYLRHSFFGLVFHGFTGDLLLDLQDEINRVNHQTC
jgi:hypothetical protein